MRRLLLAALLLCVPVAPAVAAPPDAGAPFGPALPAATYAVKPPAADPARQERRITAADGVVLYSDTWLPVAKDGGPAPPERLPVVVQYSPYATRGAPEDQARVDALVSRGFAFTQAHVRGSGGSGGCIAEIDQHEVSDGALFVEDAGERAPWASGAVGMYGGSYRGGTQLATATGADRARLRSLKALVVGNPMASVYDFFNSDGVPHLAQAEVNVAAYFALLSSPQDDPAQLLDRVGCQPAQLVEAAAADGDYTPHYAVRDHTVHLDRITAPTMVWSGSADTRIVPTMQLGLFDRLPKGLPKHMLYGVFDHEQPDRFRSGTTQPRAGWERGDWDAMLVAWYSRWLRGTKNGVDAWPVAEVQGTDGQWRTAKDWPSGTGGRDAALLLGPDGTLGAASPAGSTAYQELPAFELSVPGYAPPAGAAAVFRTPPLKDRLELFGGPELDLWVSVSQPDAHLAVAVEALGPDGTRTIPEARIVGARSLRHLDPLVDGRFRQAAGRPAPVDTPIHVAVRLGPVDMVVPKGGRLKVTVTGSVQIYDGLDGGVEGLGAVLQGPSAPSGAAPRVTILHDCAHPSALRFALPVAGVSRLIDVREKALGDRPIGLDPEAAAPVVDGGGLAVAPACGAPSPSAATLRLRVTPVRRSLATSIRRRGIPVKVSCAAACRVRGSLAVSAAEARRLRLRGSRVLARSAEVAVPEGRARTLTLRLVAATARRLARIKVVHAVVTVRASDGTRRATRRVALRLRR